MLILADGVASCFAEITDAVKLQIERRRERARDSCHRLGVDTVSFDRFPDNSFDTIPMLDVIQRIEKEITDVEPEVVYTHHYGDLNVDHELTCRATVTATRPLKDLGGFELLRERR